MSLTPYQQSIWLVMWARNLGYAGVTFIMIAILPVMGIRFMDHQVLIGLGVGLMLFFLSDRLIRYIPDPDRPKEEREPE
jgi:xanthine/uracil permease